MMLVYIYYLEIYTMFKDDIFDEELFSICKENCMLDINSLKEYNLSFISFFQEILNCFALSKQL